MKTVIKMVVFGKALGNDGCGVTLYKCIQGRMIRFLLLYYIMRHNAYLSSAVFVAKSRQTAFAGDSFHS